MANRENTVYLGPRAQQGPLRAPEHYETKPATEKDDEDDALFSWFSQQQLDSVDADDLDCPLFMTQEEIMDPKNADRLDFLTDLQYGDMTHLQIAEELKERGNATLQGGVQQAGGAPAVASPKTAIEMYEDAILNAQLSDEEGADTLQAALWSNHAAANIALNNWGKGIYSCRKAISFDKAPLKPYWRGAKCALKLKRYEDCLKFTTAGISLHPDNKDLAAFEKKATKDLAAERALQAQKDEALRKQNAEEEALNAEIQKRGITIGKRPDWFEDTYHLSGGHRPFIDEEELMHWPVAFLYPEYGQSDFVQDVCELDTLEEHLEIMFPCGEYLPWDHERKYILPKLRVYYARQTGERFPDPKFAEISTKSKVQDMLKAESLVVAGYPVLYVVSAGSEFEAKLKKGEI